MTVKGDLTILEECTVYCVTDFFVPKLAPINGREPVLALLTQKINRITYCTNFIPKFEKKSI